MEPLRFKRLSDSATLPARGSQHAAGLDLYSSEAVTLEPGVAIGVRTGLAVAVPQGFYGRVAPRSGLAIKHGIDTLAGVVDSDYRGEVVCVMINHGKDSVHIGTGSRIAQLIVEAIITPEPVWAESLDDTTRGAGGFGSTGAK